MADMSAFGAAMTSLRLAGDIAKGMLTLRDGQMLQEKVIELQTLILAAQQDALSARADHSALQDRVRELEQQIVQMKNWDHEANRYELREITPRVFVRSLKASEANGEPPHDICANCYNAGKKSILQRSSAVHSDCPSCKTRIVTLIREQRSAVRRSTWLARD